MKHSAKRSYDQAVEVAEAIAVRLWMQGLPSRIDEMGTVADQEINQYQQMRFEHWVKAGIIIQETESRKGQL